jgi:D-galactarolactone cycloisomerase
MAIREVEFVGLRSQLPQPARFSWGEAAHRNVGLVRVRTDEGIDGVGETSVTFPLWSLEERALTVREGLAPLVLGADESAIDGLVARLNATLGRLAPLWSAVAIQAAIGAFEVALWDIAGKKAGRPLFRLLNPAADRDPAPTPLYAVGFGGGPEQIAEGAAAALGEGYPYVKVRAGFGPERDRALLAAVAHAVPAMDRVLVDANMAWTREQAAEQAPVLAAYGIGWLEEPLVHADHAGLAELRRTLGVPIAAGENAYGRQPALDLLAADAVDIVMPDIARIGGLGNARAAVAAARARGLRYSPHHYASEVGFVTGLHLCAAEPGCHSLLRDTSEWPLRAAVLAAPPIVERGHAGAPPGPGLGVTLDEAALAHFRVV